MIGRNAADVWNGWRRITAGRSTIPAQSQGQFGGVNWWRRGGYFLRAFARQPRVPEGFSSSDSASFAGPNSQPQTFGPLIDDLETRLGPEVEIRAAVRREPVASATATFKSHLESLREPGEHRRKFILTELDKSNIGGEKQNDLSIA